MLFPFVLMFRLYLIDPNNENPKFFRNSGKYLQVDKA